MIRIETENPRHLSRVSMRGTWFSPQVIRVRLERTTNGLKGHCRDVLNPDIIKLPEYDENGKLIIYNIFSYFILK